MAQHGSLMAIHELPVEWKNTVFEAMTALWTKLAAFVPNVLGAIVILVVGYIVSKVLARITVAVLRKVRFELASERTGLSATLSNVGIKASASQIVGKLVFWLFMLTFLISASETLRLENVSGTIDTFVEYVPNVIAATLITVLGLALAHFVRTVVQATAESLGIGYSLAVARSAYVVLIVVVGTLAIDQLGIETELLNSLIQIVLVAIGVALAIALGMGSKDIARSIIAGVYARDLYQPGSDVRFGEYEGALESVGSITTQIRAEDGAVIHVPNDQLLQNIVKENPV